MNLATPVKEYVNPWVAFGVVGVLQGSVYGQCTTYVSRALSLAKGADVSLQGMFRGAGFAAVRDTLSQGVPFMCSGLARRRVARTDAPRRGGAPTLSGRGRRCSSSS